MAVEVVCLVRISTNVHMKADGRSLWYTSTYKVACYNLTVYVKLLMSSSEHTCDLKGRQSLFS